jgi:hypothetical protein
VYASSEEVFAEIYLPFGEKSKIVYVDLADYSGNHITGINLKVEDLKASGVLTIPDSLKTGTYLLRTFLNHNANGKVFAKDVFIANRFDEIFQNLSYSVPKTVQYKPVLNSDEITISGLPTAIGPNNAGSFEIGLSDKLKEEISGNISVVISKVCENYTSGNYLFDVGNADPGEEFIEDKGIILTGRVFNKRNNNPVPKTTVFLSVPDSIPDFNYFITNNDGLFYFKLREYYGLIPIVIQCFKNGMNDDLRIELHNKYKSSTPFEAIDSAKIDENFQEYLKELVQAATFKKAFSRKYTEVKQMGSDINKKYPFYGEPSYKVNPGLFVDLENFSEISKEILPDVKFRDKQGKLSLNVVNPNWKEYYPEQPFLMMDGIPTSDLEIIKNLKSSEIDRIDVSVEDRYFGDLNFPGVVAIYSGNKVNPGINESDKLLIVNFNAIQPPVNILDFETTDKNLPDLRQILVWNINIKPASRIYVNYRTSDIMGKFKCCVRAKTVEGDIVFSETVFEVK